MFEKLGRMFGLLPDPRLQNIAKNYESSEVMGYTMECIYQGKDIAVEIESSEFSIYVPCQCSFRLDADNRPSVKIGTKKEPTKISYPGLESVTFWSTEPDKVKSWLDYQANLDDLATVFAVKNAELELKPHKEYIELEWEHFDTATLTENKIKDMIDVMMRIAATLDPL